MAEMKITAKRKPRKCPKCRCAKATSITGENIKQILLKIWKYDNIIVGEMVTTESKYQDYVIALGRQDKFSKREHIILLSGAPT